MLGLQNAVKIADVPFPFQFTQLFNVLVIAFTVFIPIYASVFTESIILSPLIAYVVHQSILIINQVAMQLETPFGTGCNDISVKDFHARFLETIIEINPVSRYKCAESKRLLEAQAASASARSQELAKSYVPHPSLVESLGMKAKSPSPGSPHLNSRLLAPRTTSGARRSFSSLFGTFGSSSKEVHSSDPEFEASLQAFRAELEKADAVSPVMDSKTESAPPEEVPRKCRDSMDWVQAKAIRSDSGEEVSFPNQPEEVRLQVAPPLSQDARNAESQSQDVAASDAKDISAQSSLLRDPSLENCAEEISARRLQSSDCLH